MVLALTTVLVAHLVAGQTLAPALLKATQAAVVLLENVEPLIRVNQIAVVREAQMLVYLIAAVQLLTHVNLTAVVPLKIHANQTAVVPLRILVNLTAVVPLKIHASLITVVLFLHNVFLTAVVL